MKDKTVAIIILNYNSWQLTVRFIKEQISKIKLMEKIDIIVVDNCSTNDSIQQLSDWNERNKKFILLKSTINGGYAAGNNIGLRWAYENGYKYAWVVNNDIKFEDSETLTSLIDVFKNDERLGVVSPRIFTTNGMETNRNLFRPTVWDLTLGKIRYRKLGRTIPDFLRGNDGTYCYNYRPQGCCMLIDLDILNKVDYLDENTFLYMEEPILAERMLLKGFKGACCLNTRVIHDHSTTVNSVAKKRQVYKWQYESEMYYYKEYRKFNKFQRWICSFFTWIYYYFVLPIRKFN